MRNPKPSPDHHQGPAAAAATAATPRTGRFPWASVAILLALGVNLALCVRRAGGDRAGLRFVAGSHLNLLLLFLCLRRFELSPPGSAARGRARLAVWLLTTTLTAAFTWKVGALLPRAPAIAVWVMAAATILGGAYYVLFDHDEK